MSLHEGEFPLVQPSWVENDDTIHESSAHSSRPRSLGAGALRLSELPLPPSARVKKNYRGLETTVEIPGQGVTIILPVDVKE